MALTPDKVQSLAHQASTYACQALLSNDRWQEVRDQKFAELVEADARRDALTKAERICDHYATLGVATDASVDDIKRAYRRAAFNSGAPICLIAYGQHNADVLRASGLGHVVASKEPQ